MVTFQMVAKFSKRNLNNFGMPKKVQTLVFDDPAHSTKHWLNSLQSCTWAVMLLTLFLLLDESKYQPLGVNLSNKAPMMEGVWHFLYFWREYKKKTGRRWKYGLEYKKVRSGLLALTSPPASISLRLYYRACLPYIKHVIRCFKILYTFAGILWPILYSFSKVKAWMWIQNVGNKLKIIPQPICLFFQYFRLNLYILLMNVWTAIVCDDGRQEEGKKGIRSLEKRIPKMEIASAHLCNRSGCPDWRLNLQDKSRPER